MTIFEERLMNFVLEGVSFADTPLSDIKVVCSEVYGTQAIALISDCDTHTCVCTLACKPAFSDVWLISYDCMEGETENYVEAILHRILATHGKSFKYL